MKRKIDKINNKRLVIGGGINNLSNNEILVEQKGDSISLKERVGNEVKELSGGSQTATINGIDLGESGVALINCGAPNFYGYSFEYHDLNNLDTEGDNFIICPGYGKLRINTSYASKGYLMLRNTDEITCNLSDSNFRVCYKDDIRGFQLVGLPFGKNDIYAYTPLTYELTIKTNSGTYTIYAEPMGA